MIHALVPSRRLLRRAALAGLAGIVCAATLAPAQVGDLRRRAREAAANAAGVEPAADGAVAFDSVTLELTAARVDGFIKGLRASKTVLDGGRGRPGWNAMAERRDAASNDAAAIQERHGAAFDAYNERYNTVGDCRSGEFANYKEMRHQEFTQRVMTDPDLAIRLTQISQAAQAAQASGDTAAMNRAAREMEAVMGGPTRADSAAVDTKCGRLPAPPPTMVRRDSLRALTDTLNEHLRRLEIEADTAALVASGMNDAQLFQARERITAFLGQDPKAGHVYRGYTAVEVKALSARRDELVALF